jgi:hypothetical protein
MKTDPLSTTFAALADPTRRAILARLAGGAATVKELSAQWRPHRLELAPLGEVARWADNYRRFWDKSYRRLDKYLQHLKEKERNHGHDQ